MSLYYMSEQTKLTLLPPAAATPPPHTPRQYLSGATHRFAKRSSTRNNFLASSRPPSSPKPPHCQPNTQAGAHSMLLNSYPDHCCFGVVPWILWVVCLHAVIPSGWGLTVALLDKHTEGGNLVEKSLLHQTFVYYQCAFQLF